MLVTFLIMMREGVEAALIVGIVASFLKQSGNSHMIPKVWFGVILAVVLCVGLGWFMFTGTESLPRKQQGFVAGSIGLFAVGMLTYMILWMKKAARSMKKHLQDEVESALKRGNGQGWALVSMAFLAVAREGVETVFFLLAIVQQNHPSNMLLGAALGLAVAIIVGWLIFEGGVRINLARFFRWTGIFLIFVAAGLFAGAFRAYFNAGLFPDFFYLLTSVYNSVIGIAGQVSWTVDQLWMQPVLDASRVLSENSAFGSLVSGIFGYKDHPSTANLVLYFVFLIPVLILFLQGSKPETPKQAKASS